MSDVSLSFDTDALVSVEEYIELIAGYDRLTAAVAGITARVAVSQSWALWGDVSMKAFMQNRCRMTNTDAGRVLHLGQFLDEFTTIAEAATTSALSIGQVATIQAHCPKALRPFLHDDKAQSELVATIAPLPVAHGAVCMRRWQQNAEALLEQPEPKEIVRSLTCNRLPDGSATGSFVLDQAGAEALDRAIATASEWDGARDTRPVPQRRGDALFDVFDFYNKHHDKAGGPRHRPNVEIIIQQDATGHASYSTIDGNPLDPCTAQTWMCDAIYHRVLAEGSQVLEYGRSSRSFPDHIWRAIALRDRECRYPGCCRPVRHADAHHIDYWEHGGPSDYCNGILLCNRHHHLIHRPGWQIKLLPNADVEFTRPDGTTELSRPPPLP